MSSDVLSLILRARDEMSGEVHKAIRSLRGLGDTAADIGKGGLRVAGSALADVAKIAAGVAVGGFAALTGAVTLGTKALAEQAKIDAQTAAVLKSTGGAARMTAADVGKLADKIKAYSGIDDDAVKAGENMLLTFTNIRNAAGKNNDVFNQSTKVLADMSVALGTDMKTQAIQLGKALQDPEKGITALTRAGVTFTDQQKKQIATLVEHGKTLDAQKIILAELNREFGGSAKAYGDSAAGAMAKLSNAWGDFTKTLASAVLPIVASVAQALADMLNSPAVQAGAAALSSMIGQVAGQIRTTIGPVIEQVAASITGLVPSMGQVSDVMGKIGPLVAEEGAKFLSLARSIAEAVVPAVSMIIGKLVEFYPVAIQIGTTVLDLATRVWEGGLNRAVGAAAKLIGSVIDVIAGLAKAIVGNKDAMNVLAIAADLIGTAFGTVADFVGQALDFLGQFGDSIRSNKGAMDSLAVIGKAIAGAFDLARQAIGFLIEAISTVIAKAAEAVNAVASIPGVKLGADIVGAGGNIAGSLIGGIGDIISPPKRADGGPVNRGRAYLVGERGPEIFVPGASGAIVPNGAGGSLTLNVNVTGAAIFDPYGQAAQQIAGMLLPGLRRELTRQGIGLG